MGGAAGASMKLVKGFGGLSGKLGPPGLQDRVAGWSVGVAEGAGEGAGPSPPVQPPGQRGPGGAAAPPPAQGTLPAGNSPDPFILCFNK